jgi:hypothetical protein
LTTSTVYPNGWTLASSALTVPQITQLFQTLTCGMLGIVPVNYALVKIEWPVQGQPFTQSPSQNCCYLNCVPHDVEYNRVRDMWETGTVEQIVQNWEYTRGWRVNWVFYGPASVDQARQVWDATFLDWVYDQLSLSSLYFVNDPAEPVRMPEEFNAQWWERSDFNIVLYEQVNATLTPPSGGAVKSVEVMVYDADVNVSTPVADFTVEQ